MTICVSVKVSEGLVLAADSTSAVQGWIGSPQGNPGILKTYDHAKKLSHLKDYPIGTLTWGAGLIGARSLESLIKEFEYKLPSVDEEKEKAKERRISSNVVDDQPFKYSVKAIAADLLKHIKGFYDSEFADKPQRPVLGILVSGYSSGEFFPEQWKIDLPASAELTPIRPDLNGKPQFGSDWFGLYDSIVRLHWGRDDAALGLLAEHFKVSHEEIRKVLDQLQYPVIFDGMPLQDAIDYALYLVNVAIGRFRFVIGAPLCGGEIDVAVITPDNFTWINRKSWVVRDSNSG